MELGLGPHAHTYLVRVVLHQPPDLCPLVWVSIETIVTLLQFQQQCLEEGEKGGGRGGGREEGREGVSERGREIEGGEGRGRDGGGRRRQVIKH